MSADDPDRLPPGIYRVEFDDERAPLFEGDQDAEMAAWIAAGCVLAFAALAIGLGVLWLLGVVSEH